MKLIIKGIVFSFLSIFVLMGVDQGEGCNVMKGSAPSDCLECLKIDLMAAFNSGSISSSKDLLCQLEKKQGTMSASQDCATATVTQLMQNRTGLSTQFQTMSCKLAFAEQGFSLSQFVESGVFEKLTNSEQTNMIKGIMVAMSGAITSTDPAWFTNTRQALDCFLEIDSISFEAFLGYFMVVAKMMNDKGLLTGSPNAATIQPLINNTNFKWANPNSADTKEWKIINDGFIKVISIIQSYTAIKEMAAALEATVGNAATTCNSSPGTPEGTCVALYLSLVLADAKK